MIFSKIFPISGSSEIGLCDVVKQASFPGFRIIDTIDDFQISGKYPTVSDALKIFVRVDISLGLAFFKCWAYLETG